MSQDVHRRHRIVTLSALAVAAAGLSAIGLRVVAIASEAHPYYHDLVPRQLGWLSAGATLALALARMPTRWLRRAALPSLLALPLLLCLSSLLRFSFVRVAPLLLLPLILGLSSEVARLPVGEPERPRDYLLPPTIAFGVVSAAMLIPSVPAALIAFGVALAILSLVRWPWWSRIGFVGLLAAIPFAAWHHMAEYQRHRIVSWLMPDRDPLGASYAYHQSLDAIHAGGWLGSGEPWSSARPLASALSDMPFTLWTHQHGWLGALLLLGLLGLVIGLAVRLAWTTRGPFFRAIALGIAAYWLGHALLSIGGGLGLVPLNGATLPLVSYGGSGTLAAMATLGLLAHIARRPTRDSD